MESLPSIPLTEWLMISGPVLILAPVLGFLFGRFGRRDLQNQLDELRVRTQRAENESGEQRHRTLAKMRRELDTVTNLALALPHVFRDLNRDDLDPTDVPRLILQLAHAIFEPQQVLFYGIRAGRASGEERVLSLIAHHGLEQVPEALKTVRMGDGKIGWVAEHELDMLKGDWSSLRRTERVKVADNHRLLQADIIGPLVHHASEREHMLGVLCIGGPRNRPRDEKLMLQMVTNFGSMALVNAWNMKKLRSAARHDGLTGLLNKRRFLSDVARRALVQCEKAGKPFSMFIFDIDHFKNFNDTKGHPAGDELLKVMGSIIRQQLRRNDQACRYGGEEFVIAMPDTDAKTACALAENLRKAVEDEPFEHRETQPAGMISVSGGVATFPKDGTSIEELIRRADEALYTAKKSGRNRVSLYKGIDIGDPSESPPPLIDLPGDPSRGNQTRVG
jgi:diguanylate cyclase (GGDEF)-like protein